MFKKILFLGLCLFLVAGCGKIATLKNGEEAVVSLEGKAAISVDTLYENLKNSYGITKLIDMIDKIVLAKEYPDADEDKTTYINDNIAQIKAYYPEEADFLEVIRQYYGVNSEDELKEVMGLTFLRNKAILDYAITKVTDKEIEKYYKETTVGDIRASHILIKPSSKENMTSAETEAAEAEALAKANEIIAKLKKSKDITKDFADLAKKNSADTGSAKNGGDLDFFNKGAMVAEFETAAYALKKGEYTKEPVKTTHGYHIILKTDEKDKPTLEKAKSDIQKALAEEKIASDATMQIDAMTELRKKYDFKLEDSELSSQYANYIQYLLNQAKSQ